MEVLDFTKEQLTSSKGIILYGAGVWGKIVYETLESWNVKPDFFVDRFKEGNYLGVKILNVEKLNEYLDYDVLICAPSAFEEVKRNLKDIGFKKCFHILSVLKYVDIKSFENLQDRLPAEKLTQINKFYMNRSLNEKEDRIIIPQMSFSITESCTLKCEKCNALMPYYQKPETFKFETYLPSMNRMLETVDEIMEVGFIGGEPFVNKELYKYLDWAIESEKVASILVVTNSTIMPDRETIMRLKHKKCFLCLDNYGELSVKLNELEDMARKEGIDSYILNSDYWYDFGGIEKKNYTAEEKRKVFDHCPIRDCNFFIKGKFYRCQYSGSLVNLGLCEDVQGEFIDFNKDEEVEIVRTRMRNLVTRREALTACEFCNDVECSGKIPVAEQRKK